MFGSLNPGGEDEFLPNVHPNEPVPEVPAVPAPDPEIPRAHLLSPGIVVPPEIVGLIVTFLPSADTPFSRPVRVLGGALGLTRVPGRSRLQRRGFLPLDGVAIFKNLLVLSKAVYAYLVGEGSDCARMLNFVLADRRSTDTTEENEREEIEPAKVPPSESVLLPSGPQPFVTRLTIDIRQAEMAAGWYGSLIRDYFPNVTRLNLRHAFNLEVDELNAVFQAKPLRHLTVFQCGMTNAHFQGKWCSELEFLHIHSCGGGAGSLSISLLQSLPKLRTLEVEAMPLGFGWHLGGAETLSDFSGARSLVKLVLHEVSLGRAPLMDGAFKSFPNLEVLLLDGVKYLKDTAFHDLPPHLRRLRVDQCYWDGDAKPMHTAAGDIIAEGQHHGELQRVEMRRRRMMRGGMPGPRARKSRRDRMEADRKAGLRFQRDYSW